MKVGSVIIVGYLNLTTSSEECCGNDANWIQWALSSKTFSKRTFWWIFDPHPLVQHGRIVFGLSFIGKWLDKFLVHENLLEQLGYMCSCISSETLSNHAPIFLQWKGDRIWKRVPFKFNHSWLSEPEFCQLILNAYSMDHTREEQFWYGENHA